ncbi:hypothetical protein XI00_11540 [Bradyrhizobium sp. CCBAU 21359]|nr:hypothetical protein [Bradyrhizobium sp. CCBAU 21359]
MRFSYQCTLWLGTMNAVVLGAVAKLVARYQPEPSTSASKATIASRSRVLGSWCRLEPGVGPGLK